MKAGRELLITATTVALAAALMIFSGCKKSDNASSRSGAAFAADVELCTDCGQIEGSELCCNPDSPKCDGCSLAKGSPGCCKIPKGAKTAVICADCGQIKGSESCCAPNQPECPGCGLVKGSPGCYKLPKQASWKPM